VSTVVIDVDKVVQKFGPTFADAVEDDVQEPESSLASGFLWFLFGVLNECRADGDREHA
jgi:hypothetical protein